MKKKHKTLHLSKETLATLTGWAGGEAALEPESTLTPCTSLCMSCPDWPVSGACA